MKKQLIKILSNSLFITAILFNVPVDLKAQVIFDISPDGDVQLCPGTSVVLYADPLPPGYTYQWNKEVYDPGGCGFGIIAIPGATNSSYLASQTSVYWCTAIDSNGIEAGFSMIPAWVTVLGEPVNICYYPSLNVCLPDSVSLHINGPWPGYYGIQVGVNWQLNGVDIPSATSNNYYAKTSGTYRCRVYNSCGSHYSNSVVVTANPRPSAIITPADPTTFCSGSSVVLNAPVAANRSYQWKKGANLISGATLSSYTATTGGNYRVIVTNTVTGCSKTTGSATVVTVNALPTATITPLGPTTFCAGGSVVLAANTGAGLTYKWKKGSNFISGATLSNYTATTGGNYKVQVTNGNGCSKTSRNVAVSVPCKEGGSISLENIPITIGIDFTVYPNPNSGEFTIKFTNKPTASIQIELTDEIGKVVKRFETNDETVIIKESNLAKGIYCLTARNKDEVVIKKINIVK